MQPAPIHDGDHLAPDRTPPARLPGFSGRTGCSRPPAKALLRAALVAGLACAGWLVLSALAGQQASAEARSGAGDTVRHLGGPVRDIDGIAGRALGSTPRPAEGRPSRGPITGLVSTASERGEGDRPMVSRVTGGTASLGKAGLPKAPSASRLLSRLTPQKTYLFLTEAGRRALIDTDNARSSAPDPDDGGTGRGKPDPHLSDSGAATTGGCDTCAGHGRSAPRPDLPTGQDDLSGVVTQTGQAPGPMAGTPASLIEAARPVHNVRALPATVLKDGSSPARPMVVPD